MSDVVGRLATHRMLGAAPLEELAWLAERGTIRTLGVGELLAGKGQPIESLFVVLSGRIAIYIDRGTGPNKVTEWTAGEVTGTSPFSRMETAPGDAVTLEPSEVLAVDKRHLPAMIRECPRITAILVHDMLDRARLFQSYDLHAEKLMSLGRLSAGLAHQLNNPAAAIERSAALLKIQLERAERAMGELATAGLTESERAAVDSLTASCLSERIVGVTSPIQQADREERIADWLRGHGVDATVAEPLAETATSLDTLDRVAAAVSPTKLNPVLQWVSSSCLARRLACEILEAANRVSSLVAAVKGFTHMDQAQVPEPVDIGRSLENTVTMFRSKSREKSVAVTVDLEAGLPRVMGFTGELNQIWGNLIENALDAVHESGRVDVIARCESGRVVVRVVDNGSGIPEESRGKIFEPFFTTKPVGVGTGLGLDIARRLVRHNDGTIEFESRPGRTEFRVSLSAVPFDGAKAVP